jgi:bifunctional non-homologous end joining protein LigD
MGDQLSLELQSELPELPRGLRPMLARPLAEPFDSPAHLFEPVWGGVRALAMIGPAGIAGAGEIALVREDGGEIQPVPIDLAGLAMRVEARSAILDGEVVVVDAAGRLDPGALRGRLAGEAGRPLSYLAFDLVHLDGRSLLGTALERRRTLLRQVLRPGDEVVAVPAIEGEGRALFDAVAAQGLLGIRARQRGSPYLPGVRSRLWRIVLAGTGSEANGVTPEPEDVAPVVAVPSAAQKARVLALIRRLPLEFEDEPAE